MKHLTDLFTLLEVTRSQPQYGYALAGIHQNELSNLAEHHYLVAIMAWQIAAAVNAKGAKINIQKVLEFSLVHDLGELFGGDISMPYAMVNPKARTLAKAFEAENHAFFANYFGPEKEHFKELTAEIMDAKSDEALIAKVADYIECHQFKLYVGALTEFDMEMIGKSLLAMSSKLHDPIAKKEVTLFIKSWVKELPSKTVQNVVVQKKK